MRGGTHSGAKHSHSSDLPPPATRHFSRSEAREVLNWEREQEAKRIAYAESVKLQEELKPHTNRILRGPLKVPKINIKALMESMEAHPLNKQRR